MRYIPILYSPEMVQAIQDDRKTMTRRILKVKGCKPFIPDNNWDIETILNWNKDYFPYGQFGDVLWVREEHKISYLEKSKEWLVEFKTGDFLKIYYKQISLDLNKRLLKRKTLGKWQRARFFPKELCRFFLKITAIKVERLKDISRGDAMQEGCPFPNMAKGPNPIDWFFTLWTSINGKDSLDKNPWVWVISFERIDKPENFC